ncbi:hypothetical protein GCM10010112_86890 [Actinoplanes lobatus]|uniref:Transcriptional regulator with XRE-family HTH domain n=1 Tax=Actinoplanes lobatus TaxID=113568 RepID=A0A7W7HC13_9ACTN|nr:helix-turn-helix transcriptional regulator [Actinoplanes lobatus]MBB4747771.1 transcriptional regulator with XRE-family HTH domain [Actinoplanes lobatus]GGN96026.1 hypothetical protein GCM10010112_86890 [Actinoplanes lobatus]GIE45153.1 hypothetical protein Alo02nite_80510 [Actinoplanes lobatus]
MAATRAVLRSAGYETSHVVLNEDLFRSRTRALGARTDQERCAVAGISRASLYRWRTGTVTPSLDALRSVARRLDVELSQLVREVPDERP